MSASIGLSRSLELGGHGEPRLSWPHSLRHGLAPDVWAAFLPRPPVGPGDARPYTREGTVGRRAIRELPMLAWELDGAVAVPSFVENLAHTSMTPRAPSGWRSAAAIVRRAFDRRYEGDRAPFHLGAHPIQLAPGPASADETIGWEGRRLILLDALRYMASKPDVRFVGASELLDLLGVE